MTNPGQESPDNNALRELRDSTQDLNISTKKANRVMIWLTVAISILTFVLVAIEIRNMKNEINGEDIRVKTMTDSVSYKDFAINLVKVCSFFDKQQDMASYGECLQNYLYDKEVYLNKLYEDINTAFENRKKLSQTENNLRNEWVSYFDSFPSTLTSLKNQYKIYSETLCFARIIYYGPAGGPADDFVMCKIFEVENLIKRLEKIKSDWERVIN